MHGRFAHHANIGPGMARGACAASDRNSRMAKRGTGKRSCRRVTGFTGSGGREMVRRLGDDATDPLHTGRMTTGTTSSNASVIHRGSRSERGGIVAGVASSRGWKMGRRLGDDTADEFHPGRMTRGTCSRGHPTMVHQGPAERHRGFMAGLTSQCSGNVIGRLKQPLDRRQSSGIMTISTAGGDARVVVAAACEGPCRPDSMTTVAGLIWGIGWDVIGRFPGRLHSIVTGDAGTGSDSGMREGYCRPHRRTMACIARLRRWNMGRRFPPLDGIVMARGAGSRRHSIVGKEGWYPVGRAVATATIHRRWKVIRRLKRRHHPSSG
jgi:hypothetical protein